MEAGRRVNRRVSTTTLVRTPRGYCFNMIRNGVMRGIIHGVELSSPGVTAVWL